MSLLTQIIIKNLRPDCFSVKRTPQQPIVFPKQQYIAATLAHARCLPRLAVCNSRTQAQHYHTQAA